MKVGEGNGQGVSGKYRRVLGRTPPISIDGLEGRFSTGEDEKSEKGRNAAQADAPRREIIEGVDASDLARFAQRDWSALAELKADYWASMKAREGAGEGLLIADELRRHAQRLHPDWPSEEDRREDLDTHIRVSAALRSVQAVRRP